MEKYMFSDRSYFYFTDFLIAVSIIEIQIIAIAGVEDDAFRVLVLRAPVVQCLQQLFPVVSPLQIGMYAEQRQHMDRFGRQARQHGVVILQVALSAAQPGAHEHTNAPGPAFGDAQAPLRRCDQGHADQAVRHEQAQRRHVLKIVLFDQSADGRFHTALIAGPTGFEQVSEARLL